MKHLRCAVYTRKSSEEGLDQAFNSLDAQREACEAYVRSQVGEGWQLVRSRYDDGGISGGTLDRPALQQLLADVRNRKVDTVVVYKVDRLTRSLADFAKIVEVFDAHGVSFVSVTQQFNTTTSMGRLTLNMLLSFAQFEREVTGERIRDKIAASKKKGMWMGGYVPLGYEAKDRTLVINQAEAETVRAVFKLYLEHGNVRQVKAAADCLGLITKIRRADDGRMRGGRPLSRGHIYQLLKNPLYAGRIAHKGASYEGQHACIIDPETWDAVQAMLAGHAHQRAGGGRAAEPSLLAGLLFDDHGNRFSPSHAVKKGVRYRYYVSQSVLQNHARRVGAVTRLPAREIEALVLARIGALLDDHGTLVDGPGEPMTLRDQHQLIAAAKRHAARWMKQSPAGRRAFVCDIVQRIVVTEQDIRIVVGREALRTLLLGKLSADSPIVANNHQSAELNADNELVLTVSARLRMSSGELRLVIPPNAGRGLPARPNAALLRALGRAHAWKRKLFADEGSSIRTIAKEEGVTDRYISRIMRLAFLAPDIVEAILEGHQPADLELERLLKGVPLEWGEQRRRFGFATTR
ncbi:MAG: recombinase family protein [Vicinamibacterales bacterium]